MATNAQQFNANIRRIAKTLPTTMVSVFQRKLAIDLLAKVVKKTPVDTGHARFNWQLAIGTPNKDELDGKDKIGVKTNAKGVAAIAGHLPYQTIYLTNNVPYIGALENGHSKIQAPHGMLSVSMAELNVGLSQ